MFGHLGFFNKFAGKAYEDKRPRDRYATESARLLGILDERLVGHDWVMGADYSIAAISLLGWVRNLIGFLRSAAADLDGPQADRRDHALRPRALVAFFTDYNHRRAHLGISSLVPADRFYGRWPEVIAEMDAVSRRRQGAFALQLDRRLFVEPPAAGERVVALQLIFVGDQAELHLGGRRIVLGKVES